MSHTPGPWNNCGGIIYAESDGFAVAKIANEHPEQAYANMRLIKAAPDLLEELEWLLEKATQAGWPTDLLEPARSAIAKARGQS